MSQTIQDTHVALVIAAGFVEVTNRERTDRYRVFVVKNTTDLKNAMKLYLGRAGAFRIGRTATSSSPVTKSYIESLQKIATARIPSNKESAA